MSKLIVSGLLQKEPRATINIHFHTIDSGCFGHRNKFTFRRRKLAILSTRWLLNYFKAKDTYRCISKTLTRKRLRETKKMGKGCKFVELLLSVGKK